MRDQGCRKIYGLGESLGASVLIQASAIEPIFSAVVAECPFADLRGIAEYRLRRMLPLSPSLSQLVASAVVASGLLYARWVEKLDFREVSPTSNFRRSSTPTLLIHGLDDKETPPNESRRLAAARPEKTQLWLVPHASHTNASTVFPSEFQDRVLAWLAQN
jgi:hypothetical protein